MTLQQISLGMFAAAGSGGLLFTLLIGLRKRYPRALVAGHGLLGMAALCVLGYALLNSPTPAASGGWLAMGVLGAAWCGGVVLFRVLRPKGNRFLLAWVHGGLAALGIGLLYQFAF